MLTMRPAADRFTVHAGAGALATSTKHSGTDRVSGQLFRGDAVLALPAWQKIYRDRVGCAPGLDPKGEPCGHPHQMGVVQFGVAAVVQPPPPGA